MLGQNEEIKSGTDLLNNSDLICIVVLISMIMSLVHWWQKSRRTASSKNDLSSTAAIAAWSQHRMELADTGAEARKSKS